MLLAAFAGMGSLGYWKARHDMVQIIDELKNDLPAFAGILGKSLFKSANATRAAEASAEARIDKGLSERMLDDFLNSQSPWAKMLVDYGKESIPYLKDHPELITQIIPLAQQFFGARSGKGGQFSNSSEPKLGLQP